MNSSARWSHYFEEVTKGLSSCALSTPQGDLLFVRAATLSDIGTFPVLCQTVSQYVKLKKGQIALVNDISCGGTTLQTFTLVAGTSLDLVVASRFRLRPTLAPDSPNSLRIPPTPLVGFEGFPTNEILKAISQHPSSPPDFLEKIQIEIRKLQTVVGLMEKTGQDLIPTKKSQIELYLRTSQERHAKFLDELPFETVSVTREFDKSGRLQLTVSNANDGLHLDFSGSESPYKCTQPMTVGACVGAINAMLGVSLPINHGHLRNVTVHTQTQSPLNANPQQMNPLGELILVPLIANTVIEGLSKMMKKSGSAESGVSLLVELKFNNGRSFFERLSGGSAGTYLQAGLDGVDIWNRLPLLPSIEDMESRFPFSIVCSERCIGSGGRGIKAGGAGVRRTFHFFEGGTLFWAIEQSRVKPNGSSGGSSGDGTELTLHRANGETLELKGQGEVAITPNDSLTLLSAGGGGFGRTE